MTEVERIIESGFLPKEYFREEVMCDFLVTEERKKLWGIMLDMINAFDIVCKKYKLTYFLAYGSLLGAIRHHGFIPWDDDFDVLMPRADYERFVLLKDEFQYPHFLQTPYTDPEYAYTFAKIRNSNTTGIVQMFKYSHFNHGLWISIFPLDYLDMEKGEENFYKIRKLATDNSTYMRLTNPNLDDNNKKRVAEYAGNHLKDYEEIQRLASYCRNPDSKHVIMTVNTIFNFEKMVLDAADFASVIEVPFENLTLPAPIGYDHLLSTWYRDPKSFPPVERRGLRHEGTVFDPDISYTEYLKREGIL